MTFEVALTGLNAASTELDVISNNIANSATTGFKESRADFADVYAVNSLGATGRGVRVSDIKQNFGQGDLEATANNLDLAVEGEGMFSLSDNGVTVYTRAGNFGLDAEGFVVSTENHRLQGYASDENGEILPLLGDLRVDFSDVQPRQTDNVMLSMNLDAEAEIIVNPAFDDSVPEQDIDPESYNFSTPMTVYDSLGASQTATTYFRKTAENTWSTYLFVDGEAASPVGGYELVFTTDGALETIDGAAEGTFVSETIDPASGGSDMSLTFDISSISQFHSKFGVNQIVQDGYATGRLDDVDIDQQGNVFGRYSNGETKSMGRIVLTNFTNEQGLMPIGNTLWAETPESGSAATGEAGSASLGLITSGSLEQSNVDLTEELVAMISAQRNFQANAQVISAADTITQTIINIRR